MEKRIGFKSGCKVGWDFYATEAGARAAVERVVAEAKRQAVLGYDFGYCCPGEVRHVPNHPEYGDCWMVTTS